METSKTTRELAIGWFNSKASLERGFAGSDRFSARSPNATVS